MAKTPSNRPPELEPQHFSFRIPAAAAKHVVDASVMLDMNLNVWCGRACVVQACQQLNLPIPPEFAFYERKPSGVYTFSNLTPAQANKAARGIPIGERGK